MQIENVSLIRFNIGKVREIGLKSVKIAADE